MKIKKFLINTFILAIILGLIGGVFYFKGYFNFDFLKFWESLKKQVENLKDIKSLQILPQIEESFVLPKPLIVKGPEKDIILEKTKIIEYTNLKRKENNLPALKENYLLSQAALLKAKDMFENQYFDHVSPSGLSPSILIKSVGYEYLVAGENLILGNFSSEEEVIEKWMESPDHRTNILNKRYTEIGVAILKGNYQGDTVWIGVQEFALPLSVCPQPDLNLKNEIEFKKQKLESLYSQIIELRNKIERTNRHHPSYNQLVNEFNQLVQNYNLTTQQLEDDIKKYNNQVQNFNACLESKR